MPSAELELITSIDTSQRVRQTRFYAEYNGFNRIVAETHDPDPNSGSNDYNDDSPYPFSSQEVDYNGAQGRSETVALNEDSHGKKVRLALFIGSIILFVALVTLVVLSRPPR